jgi:hypothetical protein
MAQNLFSKGHWLKFAQDISRRDNTLLDQDVKMYFLNQLTAMDCFVLLVGIPKCFMIPQDPML